MTHDQQDFEYLKGLTILYVEDDNDVRQQLEPFLKRRCGTLLTARNGREGLEIFRKAAPHLVITDIQMPVMDGLTMLQEINHLGQTVPSIVTTAFEQTDYLLRSIDIGVDKYVVKPVITERLYSAILECSHRLRTEAQLKLAAKVFEHSLEAIMITDADNLIVSVNPAFCTITGYEPGEVIGRDPRILASGNHNRQFYTAMWQDINTKGSWQGEIMNRGKNGTIYPEWLSITTLMDAHNRVTHRIGIFSDISERKATEDYFRNLALHDPLTGLPNRSLLKARFELALASALRNREQLALLFVDLDNFKTINDSYGHYVGDLVLQDVALRLQEQLRASDTVSRIGGDEFLVVVNAVSDTADAVCAAEKVQAALAEALEVGAHRITVTPSIGVALYPQDGTDMETLIRNADSAMYHAKQQGRNQVVVCGRQEMAPGSLNHLSQGRGDEVG